MIDETRKIWGDQSIEVAPTCVRVPVLRAHAESIHVTLGEAVEEGAVREVLASAPGVRVVDDRGAGVFPMSVTASGEDDVLVGRIRPAADDPGEGGLGGTRFRSWELFVAGDQIRKGAALNAWQIAARLLGR